MSFRLIKNCWKWHKIRLITFWLALVVGILSLNISLGRLLASLYESEARRIDNSEEINTLYTMSIKDMDLYDYDNLLFQLHQIDLCQKIWINYSFSKITIEGDASYYDEIEGNMMVEDGILKVIPISINGLENDDIIIKAGRFPKNANELLSFGNDLNANFKYTYNPDNPPLYIRYSLNTQENISVVGIIDNSCGLQGLSTSIDYFKTIFKDMDSFYLCILINDRPNCIVENKIEEIVSEYSSITDVKYTTNAVDDVTQSKFINQSVLSHLYDLFAVLFLLLYINISIARYFYSGFEPEYNIRIKLGSMQTIKYVCNLRICILLTVVALAVTIPMCSLVYRLFYSDYRTIIFELIISTMVNSASTLISTKMNNRTKI